MFSRGAGGGSGRLAVNVGGGQLSGQVLCNRDSGHPQANLPPSSHLCAIYLTPDVEQVI